MAYAVRGSSGPLLQLIWSRIRETTKANLAPTKNLKISVVHGAENPFVAGRVVEHPCHLTIDTGNNLSIILPDVLSKQKQTLVQPVSQSISTVTGEMVPKG